MTEQSNFIKLLLVGKPYYIVGHDWVIMVVMVAAFRMISHFDKVTVTLRTDLFFVTECLPVPLASKQPVHDNHIFTSWLYLIL